MKLFAQVKQPLMVIIIEDVYNNTFRKSVVKSIPRFQITILIKNVRIKYDKSIYAINIWKQFKEIY